MSLAREFGEITFGEINNSAIKEYTDSFDDFFNSEDLNDKYDSLKEFGTFKFGEINNILLYDFERALNRFIFSI